MNDFINQLKEINLLKGTLETLYMVFVSSLISFLIGTIIALVYVYTDENGLKPNKIINKILDLTINIGRSIPFIILAIILMPLSLLIFNKTYGNTVFILPLTISAIPFVSRMQESIFKECNKNILETVIVCGARTKDIIFHVYIKESLPQIIRSFSIVFVNIVGYSAMAGSIGAGGLGKIAITEGYHKYDFKIMFTVLILIIMVVQFFQYLFEKIAKKIDKK